MDNRWFAVIGFMFLMVYYMVETDGRLDEIEKDLGLVKQVTGYTVCVKSHGCEFYPTLKVHGMITDDGRNTGLYETEKGNQNDND